MATFEISANGQTFEIEAPDEQAAMDAFSRYSGDATQQSPVPERQPTPDTAPKTVPAFPMAAVESFPIAGPYLRGGMENAYAWLQNQLNPGLGSVEQNKQQASQLIEDSYKADPVGTVAGQVTGTVAPFAVGGAIPGVARVLGMSGGLGSQVLFGAGSGAVIGAADTLARGGSMDDAKNNAGLAAGIAAAVPVAGKALAPLFRRGAPKTPPTPSSGSGGGLPSIDDLYAAKNAAYQAVDNSGVRYSAPAMDSLLQDMYRRVAKMSPTRHKAAFDMLSDIESRRGPMSLSQLDELRQEIWRDVAGLTSPEAAGDAHFGKLMIEAIDDFIEKAQPAHMVGGNPQAAHQAITTARAANSTFRKAEALQNILEETQRRVAASGSGGNIDNALRQAMNSLLKNPRLHWTPDERKLIGRVVMGNGKLHDVIRLTGKLSPSGNGLMAMLGVGGTAFNPLFAAVPAIGLGAKALSDRATKAGVEKLTRTIRGGGQAPVTPPMLPIAPAMVPQLLLPKENTPLQITIGTRGAPTFPYP